MTPVTDAEAASFERFIDSHAFFLVAGHREPDGDCLASCIGVGALLDAKKKPYQFFSAGPFKRSEIKRWEQQFPKKLPEYSADTLKTMGIILVDCSEKDRLGEINLKTESIDTFVIDHHRTSGGKAERGIIDPTSPSATVLVQQLYEKLVGPLDALTSETLFFGLATDTGFFRFVAPKDGEVFRTASRLIDGGADPRAIYDAVSGSKPFLTRKLLAVTLGRAEQKCGGRVIYTYETLDDTRK
jgi:phosphoesterase RecJ-like protein